MCLVLSSFIVISNCMVWYYWDFNLLTLLVLQGFGFSVVRSVCFNVQEELVTLRRQLDGRDGDLRRLQDETGSRSPTPAGLDSTERGGSCNVIKVLPVPACPSGAKFCLVIMLWCCTDSFKTEAGVDQLKQLLLYIFFAILLFLFSLFFPFFLL